MRTVWVRFRVRVRVRVGVRVGVRVRHWKPMRTFRLNLPCPDLNLNPKPNPKFFIPTKATWFPASPRPNPLI